MSTHELEHNVAGDVVGCRPHTTNDIATECAVHGGPWPCRHDKTHDCPYCKECGEDERN